MRLALKRSAEDGGDGSGEDTKTAAPAVAVSSSKPAAASKKAAGLARRASATRKPATKRRKVAGGSYVDSSLRALLSPADLDTFLKHMHRGMYQQQHTCVSNVHAQRYVGQLGKRCISQIKAGSFRLARRNCSQAISAVTPCPPHISAAAAAGAK